MKNKTSIVSVRVTEDIKNKLEAESKLHSITLNALIGQIITKHVSWDRFVQDIGFVSITRQFFRATLNYIDDEIIKTIAVSTCRSALRDAMLFVTGKVSVPSFIEILDLWLTNSSIPFRHYSENGIDKYIIQHELGNKWTIYLVTVISSMLNEMGYKMDKQEVTEQTIAFQISKL